MSEAAITTSPVFLSRLARSEQWRAAVLAGMWTVALITMLVHRALKGVLLSIDSLFHLSMILVLTAIAFQIVVYFSMRRFARERRAIPAWRWMFSAAFDLAIPITGLFGQRAFSTPGTYESIAPPGILVISLITALSILRLKPWVSLCTGLIGGIAHWVLVIETIRAGSMEPHHWPLLFTYGLVLTMIGVGCAVVSAQVRKHVREAVGEALKSEQAERALVLIERDLAVAREIQQSLMPGQTPAIAGFDIAGMARPAQQTGGDYYDWQELPGGRLGVVLADVTGHGVGPALVMAVCRAYVRASTPRAADLDALLTTVNELVCEDLGDTGRFITMVTAVVSPEGRVHLASAGHGPTLLYRAATRDIEVFKGDGLPLGVDHAEQYGPHATLRLERGDVLLMLTDGFMEWARASDGEQFGLERLRATLRDAAGGTARSILDELDLAVKSFAGGSPQLDDTTAVAIRRE